MQGQREVEVKDKVLEIWIHGGTVRRDTLGTKDGIPNYESISVEVPEYLDRYRRIEAAINDLYSLGIDITMETISYESDVTMKFLKGAVGTAMVQHLVDELGS